jgi:hypothetical protein
MFDERFHWRLAVVMQHAVCRIDKHFFGIIDQLVRGMNVHFDHFTEVVQRLNTIENSPIIVSVCLHALNTSKYN